MRYDKPELRQQLAAEYALGTLRGRARARFERLLKGDATLKEEVVFWQARFSDFAARLKPVAPREVVWAALEKTIHADRAVVTPLTPRQSRSRMGVWQIWAAAATIAAVAMGFGLRQQLDENATLAAELAAAQSKPLPYVAVFQAEGGDARWAISLHAEQKLIRVMLSGDRMPADVKARSLELWMLDSKGKPHSLGLLPVAGKHSHDLPMPEMPASELGAVLTLAVSEEPRGGSPTGLPTGKVLGAVPAVRPI
jgi:anti-sigma-K factor RskA